MTWQGTITLEPGKRGGRPCIRNMRIAVADVLGWLAAGMSHEEILSDYPELTDADIRACLSYAADRERGVLTAACSCYSTRILASNSVRFSRISSPHSKPVRELDLDRSDDRVVWQHAKYNGFVLVSQDSDFADMAAHY